MRFFLNKFSLVVFLMFFSGKTVHAQNFQKELDHLFNEVTASPEEHFNGVALVAAHGEIIYQNAKGFSDIGAQKINTIHSRFQLASLSKVFTATAVMQLAEKGSLNLNDSFVKYFPSFPYPTITIRQLLSHTSGLPDFKDIYAEKSGHPLNNSDMIPAVISYGKLVAPPSTRWYYSSVGYALLANLVEKISGLSFAVYVNEHICKPAGMLHSYVLSPYEIHPDSLRAICYMPAGPGPLTDNDSVRTELASPWQTIVGPGLMVSSAEDLLLFSESLFNNVILSAASQAEMYTPVKLSDGKFAELSHAPIYAGLGWGIDIDNTAGTIVSHNGGSRGISTILLRDLQRKQTVIVLENSDNMATLSFGVNAMNVLHQKPIRQFGPGPGHP